MPDWINIDPKTIKEEKLRNIRGVQLNVQLSPYDIPEAVRGYYNKKRKIFVIEFRYLSDEPTKNKKLDKKDNLSLKIGRNSHRLYGIEIDVDAMEVQAVKLKMMVERAMDDFTASADELREGNYRLTRDIIQQQGNQIFSNLTY